MPQPQPNNSNVKRIIGLCLTIGGVISVLLIVAGLACNMTQTLNDNPKPEVGIDCTNMLSTGFVGIVIVIILRAWTTLIPK